MRRKISLAAFLYSLGFEPQLEELQLKGTERQAAARARTHNVAAALRRGECVPQGGSAVERVEQILDWAAVAYPGQFVGYPDIAKAALRLDRRPRAGSIDIKRARKLVQNVAGRLWKDGRKVKRWVLTEAGVGARATVDRNDARQHFLPGVERRRKAAGRAALRHLLSIDFNKLAVTPAIRDFAHSALETLRMADWTELRSAEAARLPQWRAWALGVVAGRT